jgi:hypothetical protein
MGMRFLASLVLFFFSFVGYSIQLEYLDIGPKSLGLGGGGKSLIKDPTSVFLNPANMCLEKSSISLYYEASSYLTIGSVWDLAGRKFVFDPANFGLTFKSSYYTSFGVLLANYLEDYDFPQTKYKVLSFGFSLKALPFLLGGISLGPVVGFNDRETSSSLILSSGVTFKFDNFSSSFVFRTPTSLAWNLNPYYPELRMTVPPFLGFSSSFFVGDIVIVFDADYLFLSSFSFDYGGRNLFLPRENFFDSLLLKLGFLWYDDVSGFRIFGGVAKKQIDSLSLSIPQIHLTAGTTFFVRIPGMMYDLEFNFSLDDQYLLQALGIWPMNVRKISLSVSVEMRL